MLFIKILAAFFFLASLGSLAIYRKQVAEAKISQPTSFKYVSYLLSFAPVVLFVILLMEMVDLAWYWLALIIVPSFILSSVPAALYISVFGKMQEVKDHKTGEVLKQNNFLMDSIITLAIGLVLMAVGYFF